MKCDAWVPETLDAFMKEVTDACDGMGAGVTIRYKQTLDFLPLAQVGAAERCLDIGCGPGQGFPAITAKGYRPLGLDLNPDFARPAMVFTADVRDMREVFVDGYFAAVTLVQALYLDGHDQLVKAFKEVKRVLMPGKPFIVYAGLHSKSINPAFATFQKAITDLAGEPVRSEKSKQIKRTFESEGDPARDPGEVKAAMADAGFSPVEETTVGGFYQHLGVAINATRPNRCGRAIATLCFGLKDSQLDEKFPLATVTRGIA